MQIDGTSGCVFWQSSLTNVSSCCAGSAHSFVSAVYSTKTKTFAFMIHARASRLVWLARGRFYWFISEILPKKKYMRWKWKNDYNKFWLYNARCSTVYAKRKRKCIEGKIKTHDYCLLCGLSITTNHARAFRGSPSFPIYHPHHTHGLGERCEELW